MAAVVGDDGGSPDVATSLDDARMFRPPKLNLAERRMFHVPPEIVSMHFLEELSLAGNRISALPAGCLPPSLHALTLTGNILDTLPHHIMALPLLQRLNCGANRLSSCEIIFQCSALLHAGLSFNHISSFVVPDGRAPPLISLDLSNNKLENLAQTLYELRKLPHLASLSLLGNPFCMRKGFHDKVLRQLPKLVFFNGKKRVVKDAEGEGADHFPMPEDSEAGTNGQTPEPEDVAAKGSAEDPPSVQLVSLRLEMRSLTIRDPRQPVAPEWAAAVADASATKAKKGKTEDSVPLIPPVRYSVEWEMADGRAVSTFCKKVEIDPRKLAELAAAAEGGAKTPTTEPTPSMEGCSTVVMELPANTQTRNWLRSGFRCKLWRSAELLERTLVSAATEKEAEQWSYSFRHEEAMLAVGTCSAPEVIDTPGLCKVKVPLVEEPALWDANGIRMGLLDERHSKKPTATIVAAFHLHWTPPPPPVEPVTPSAMGKGKSLKKK